ncbi:CsbD family protein [uncultured Sphingomonas sp.]|uniref:CsbD family protein n=1 Tax=uncultured Sphingomonas sp. TaxID=158754 RepID=UPI0025E85851|nr:CsbD family protein [uncultured Sphingomonas sp.]
MNSDTLTGTTTDLGGKLKEGLGKAFGDDQLRAEGTADRVEGTVQKTFGDAKDGVRPLIDQARRFVNERPFAAAAVGGVLGLALLNTLRGK